MIDEKNLKALAAVLAKGRPVIVGELRGIRKQRLQGKAKATGKDYDMKHIVYTVELGDLANTRAVAVKMRIPDDVDYDKAQPIDGVKKGCIAAFTVAGLDTGGRDGAVWEAEEGVVL